MTNQVPVGEYFFSHGDIILCGTLFRAEMRKKHRNSNKIPTCNFFELTKLSKSNTPIKLDDKSSQCKCGMCPKISRDVF